jgi:hypothetical protein
MNKILTILIAIGSAVVGLFSLFLAGVKKGTNDERTANAQRNLEQAKLVKKINDEIDTTSVDDMRKQLRKDCTSD